MKDRHYALLIPWFMDGALGMITVAVPLLAIRYGASAMLIGIIGLMPQAMRLPLCLTSGHLSEMFGRKKIILPAGLAVIVAALMIAAAKSNPALILPFALSGAAMGAFYPPLEAMIGDVSKIGELTTNLGRFNLGWCVGSAVTTALAMLLVAIDIRLLLYGAAVSAFVAFVLVASWKYRKADHSNIAAAQQAAGVVVPDGMLTIARITHFTGFYGVVTVRMLYPKLGNSLGWSDAEITKGLTAVAAGLAVSMIINNASVWWRAKIWPQIAAQAMLIASAVLVLTTTSPVTFGIAFFGTGAALGIAYTAALYHGLSNRTDHGKNTSIHESLIAVASIASCLVGGWVAQSYNLRAPYVLVCVMAALCMLYTVVRTRVLTSR